MFRKMNGINKIIFAASIIANVNAQWPSSMSNTDPQYRYPEQHQQQQQPQQVHQLPSSYYPTNTQQWTNNYNGQQNWGNTQSGQYQNQNQQGWNNGNNMQAQQYQQQQPQQDRDANLVDYPFTVEFVDRRRQTKLLGSTSHKGIGAFSRSKLNDDNLIDYPFTVEYRSNNPPAAMNHAFENPENRGQASLHPNQELFQPTEQQRYQHNHHHQNAPANPHLAHGSPNTGGVGGGY